MKDTQNGYNNKPNRTRRAVFVFGGTIGFAVAAFYVTVTGGDSSAAETFIKGSLGIIEIIVITYLATTTLDRSEILKNLGSSMKKNSDDDDDDYNSNSYRRNNRTRNRSRNRDRQPYEDDMSDEDGAMG